MIAGIIGLGRMGSAIAQLYSEKGLGLVVWTRDKSRLKEVAKRLGADTASSPREVADRADYVHVVVSDDHALYNVVLGENGVLASSNPGVVVNHVTCTIRASLELMRLASSKNVGYVEAPIIGGPSAVRKGEALVLCSSVDERLCEIESLPLIGETIYLGSPPKALAAKLGFNHLFLSMVSALADAFALVEAYGIRWENYVNLVLARTWLRQLVERYRERFSPEREASFSARLAGKDARYVAEALVELGLDSTLAASVANHYATMLREGLGESDYPSLAGFFALLGRRIREGKQ